MRRMLELLSDRLMKRPLRIDARVPGRYLFGLAVCAGVACVRGLLRTRRRMLLGKGARITDVRRLSLGGGLVRVDEHCRIDCLGVEGVHLGRNARIGAWSRLVVSGSLRELGRGIRIGDDVGIGEFAYIGGAGGVSIGDGTIIGQYFSAHPENHVFDTTARAIREQGVTRRGIAIGSGCWIGAKVTVCDGAAIGDRCVVAAGSVVVGTFPSGCLLAGVPARIVRRIGEATEGSDVG